jgi:CheY-like chemotaxis protein
MTHALIIEDSPLIAMMLQDHLAECGYATADIALTQTEAIVFAERHCPDIITADDRLDDGSGVEAIRHICRDQAIPVIFIVADPENVETQLPDAITLQKPFSEAALNDAILLAKERPLVFA